MIDNFDNTNTSIKIKSTLKLMDRYSDFDKYKDELASLLNEKTKTFPH